MQTKYDVIAGVVLYFLCFGMWFVEERMGRKLFIKLNGHARGYALKRLLQRIKRERSVVDACDRILVHKIVMVDRITTTLAVVLLLWWLIRLLAG